MKVMCLACMICILGIQLPQRLLKLSERYKPKRSRYMDTSPTPHFGFSCIFISCLPRLWGFNRFQVLTIMTCQNRRQLRQVSQDYNRNAIRATRVVYDKSAKCFEYLFLMDTSLRHKVWVYFGWILAAASWRKISIKKIKQMSFHVDGVRK